MNQPGQGGQMPTPPPPPPGGMPSWTNNLTARGTMAGPAGVALADIPDRAIAYVIDAIIIGIVGYIITIITTSVLGDNIFGGILGLNVRVPSLISSIVAVVLLLIVSGAYYIYMWSRMGGATVGMKVMKISVRDASSGATVSQGAAINRWLLVGAPFALYPLYQWSIIGWLVGLLVLAYLIYLLVTIAQSSTRQGFHDVYAKTVVAKG